MKLRFISLLFIDFQKHSLVNDIKAELQHHNYVTDLAQSVKTLAHKALQVK